MLLPYHAPLEIGALLDFLGAHAVPGLERYADGTYARLVPAPGGPALVAIDADAGRPRCELRLSDPADEAPVVTSVRRLLDLDTDPDAIEAVLGEDPALGPLVRKRPGLRALGAVDGFETTVRTIVGQQISVSGARTVLGRIVAAHGEPAFAGQPWRLFPTAERLAGLDPAQLPMPRARGRAVVAVAQAFASGAVALAPGADRAKARAALLALPGVGPWTADYLLMRVLGDPDVLLATDLAARRAADDLGISLADGRPSWAPWRSYATYHLWAHLYADKWKVPR